MNEKSKIKATRDEFGEALIEVGIENKDLIVIDADNSLATRTIKFARYFPDRFINVGIAEQNMVGIAAGLVLSGKLPVVSTHAIFLCGRAYEQIRNVVGYGELNVKFVGSHSGITVGYDGPTHFAIEDIALMRSIPGMTVIVPADAPETRNALRAALEHIGPTYLRLGRAPVPVISNELECFEIGRGILFEGGNDVAIIACGLMVAKALEAKIELQSQGVGASVVNIHTIKPLDENLIESLAKCCRTIVVAEEHSIYGGLGSAVAEVVCNKFPVPIEFVGIRDTFAESGEPKALLKRYGLETIDIITAARKAIERKE